jgi:release factor glutamine methyltransferase
VTGSPSWADIVTRLRSSGCVFAEDEADLLLAAASTGADLQLMLDRRVVGVPLEQVIGWAEFCGLRILVEPGVFVPRRRSEFLVGQALALGRPPAVPGPVPPIVVLDMCCGSGAVGLAVATSLGTADLHAADVDGKAVECATANLGPRGGHVYQGDLYEPLPDVLRGAVRLLLVNAPYVPTSEVAFLPAEARLHEPLVALDGGADGVEIHRRVAAGAADWLAPDGHLLIETSERQAPLTSAAVAGAGLRPRVVTSDELSATVVIGCRPASG